MHVIAIGRLRDAPEASLFDRYSARLHPALRLTEIAEARGAPTEVKRRESLAVLAALPRQAFVVALDQGGNMLESHSFAVKLAQWGIAGHPVCFLIGGAEGLDAPLIARADFVLSLGAMTWPHFLVRAMLAEQLYRAQAITAGHPYHRSGRSAR